uniref:Dynein light chain n=1 Tax=Moschus moschiferus TaxID=68415 RepID=A0A8C6G163_MOSMO
MCDRKAEIKNADMSEEMQQDLAECATQALEKYNIEKDTVAHIKKEFNKKHNPTWHFAFLPILLLLCMEEYYSEVHVEKCMAEKLLD